MKKVCYKVSLRESRQAQCCKTFIGLSICAKMVVRGRTFLRKNLVETDPPFQKCRFPINICS